MPITPWAQCVALMGWQTVTIITALLTAHSVSTSQAVLPIVDTGLGSREHPKDI